jgi:hypothetical protein
MADHRLSPAGPEVRPESGPHHEFTGGSAKLRRPSTRIRSRATHKIRAMHPYQYEPRGPRLEDRAFIGSGRSPSGSSARRTAAQPRAHRKNEQVPAISPPSAPLSPHGQRTRITRKPSSASWRSRRARCARGSYRSSPDAPLARPPARYNGNLSSWSYG